MIELFKKTKKAAAWLALTTDEERNVALEGIADGLIKNAEKILQANEQDIAAAKAR